VGLTAQLFRAVLLLFIGDSHGISSAAWRDKSVSTAERMLRDPVPREVYAPADPDLVPGLDIVEEAAQRRKASGAAGQTAVQPDRHHLG
jgi:hypothetical protein